MLQHRHFDSCDGKHAIVLSISVTMANKWRKLKQLQPLTVAVPTKIALIRLKKKKKKRSLACFCCSYTFSPGSLNYLIHVARQEKRLMYY